MKSDIMTKLITLLAFGFLALAGGCGATNPPLVDAAKGDQLDMAKALVDSGAKVDDKGKYDYTSLHWAAYNGDAALAQTLLDHGASPDVREYTYSTPLILAVEYSHPDVVPVLISHHADVNAKDRDNWTALMWASKLGDLDSVKAIVQAGADINWVEPKNHDSALTLAIAKSHVDVIEFLNKARTGNLPLVQPPPPGDAVANVRGNPAPAQGSNPLAADPSTSLNAKSMSVSGNPPTTQPANKPKFNTPDQ